VTEITDLLSEFNRINEKFADPLSDEEMAKLIERQGRCRRSWIISTRGISIRGSRWRWTRSDARRGTRR